MLAADGPDALAGSEDGGLLAAPRTAEQGHVLHEAQDGHVYLAEHVDPLYCIFDGEGVGGRHDDGAWASG